MSQSKKTYHHGDLRRSLLDSAGDLLEEKGPDGISLREVAKRAGVSHTAPYRHFKDKQNLLDFLAAEGFKELAAGMQSALEHHKDDPAALMAHATEAYVKQATAHPQMTQLMFGGVLDPSHCPEELQQIADEAYDGLQQVIASGSDKGFFVNQCVDVLALATWSMVHGLAMLYNAGMLQQVQSPDQLRELTEQMTQLLLYGMAKQQPAKQG